MRDDVVVDAPMTTTTTITNDDGKVADVAEGNGNDNGNNFEQRTIFLNSSLV